MPRRTVKRVVETLEFEFSDKNFRKWAKDHADLIADALEPRLAKLTSRQMIQAGRLMLSTGDTAKGTELLCTALANARDETDLRHALAAFSGLPKVYGPPEDLQIEVDIDRPQVFAAVKPYLRHFNKHIRSLARGSINRLELPDVEGLQREWLTGDDPDAQRDAALALGMKGDPAAWPILKPRIKEGQGRYWQPMVYAASEICWKAKPDLRAEIAEFARDEIRARLHLNDNSTANQVMDLRRVVSAGGQPWQLDFLEEQLKAKTCFAEYVVGEWAWRTGPSAIPRLIEYLDDPVLSRGVIDYVGKSSNPKLGAAEDQAPLKARLEKFMVEQADKTGPFASDWRSQVARALEKLGAIETVEPENVSDEMAYKARLKQVGLTGDVLVAELLKAFPSVTSYEDNHDEPFGALMTALHEDGLFVMMSSDLMDYDSFVDSVDEVLALAAPAVKLNLSEWPEKQVSDVLQLSLQVDGKTQPFLLRSNANRVIEYLLEPLNTAIAHTGYMYVLIDLDTGGDFHGITIGKADELKRLANEIKLPVIFVT